MFMLFNVIFIVVTGLASAAAITADNARDARQAAQAQAVQEDCVGGVRPDGTCPSGSDQWQWR